MSRVAQPTGLKPADITGASTKATPVSGDGILVVDSEDSDALKLISPDNLIGPQGEQGEPGVVTGGIQTAELFTARTDDSNLFPDPFFADTTLESGYLTPADSPVRFAGAWTSLAKINGQKYPVGKALVRPLANVSRPYIYLSLDKLGLVEGDTFYIALEARAISGSATSGDQLIGEFLPRTGTTAVGSSFDVIVPTVDDPLDSTLRQFKTVELTVPAGAGRVRLASIVWFNAEWATESIQITREAPEDEPIQNHIPENLAERFAVVEAANMQSRQNNLLLKRTSFAASEVTQSLGGISNVAAFGGYGQSFLAAACPAAGFNAIQDSWKWTSTGDDAPVEIIVAVTTSATGDNPLNEGKLIAFGSIGVDPSSGSGDGAPVQLFSPDGTPKTIVPADLSDLMGISFIAITASGSLATNIAVSRQNTDTSLSDPANVGYFIPSGSSPTGLGAGWSSIGTSFSYGPKLVKLTDPVTAPDVASVKLAKSIGAKVDELPLLQTTPSKLFCIVGKSTWLHYQTIQMRDYRRTAFSASASASLPSDTGNFVNGWKHTPASAGTITVTLKGEANGLPSASKSCAFSAVTAATGAGTGRFLMLGDSITASGGVQSRLNTLATADGVTSIVNMGTIGSDPVKNEGYSGQANGIFFTSGNPFYNPSSETFDFDYYMTNSQSGESDPTHILLAGGFWNAASKTSDGDAASSADFLVSQLEEMITSIHAYNSAIKVGVWSQPQPPYDGQDGDSDAIIPGISSDRRRRNLLIFGQKQIEAFEGREGDNIYSVACGNVMNPDTAYTRADFVPKDSSVAAKVSANYADYATLAADLTPADGTIVSVTNGSGLRYYVKVWGTGLGHWRTADETDGFVRRVSDSVHPGTGYAAMGDLVFAWIKATL